MYICNMRNNYYIYLHIKETDGTPFYVGKGSGKRSESKQRSLWWNRIVNKYGYDIIFLEEDLINEEALEREIYWIKRIGRRDLGNGPLVNLTDGGEGGNGAKRSEETKKKMSESKTGLKHSKETCERISKVKTGLKYSDEINKKKGRVGDKNGMFGKTHSDEAKKKISQSLIGNTGLSGDKNGMFGKTHSDEARKRMSEQRSGDKHNLAKTVLDLETGIYYTTIKDCAEAKGIVYSTFKNKLKNNEYTNLIKI